jgi:purine catabolism regulator
MVAFGGPVASLRRIATVEQLIRTPLMRGTKCLAARSMLASRDIRWFSVIESPAKQEFVQAGDLVMTTAHACDTKEIVELVNHVADAEPAALIVSFSPDSPFETVPVEAVDVADARQLPLLLVPWAIRFAEIARFVVRSQARSDESTGGQEVGAIGADLLAVLLAEGGASALAEVAYGRLDRSVLILAPDLRVEAAGARDAAAQEHLIESVRDRVRLLSTADVLALRSQLENEETVTEALEQLGLAAGDVVAVGAGRHHSGYVYVADQAKDPEGRRSVMMEIGRAFAIDQLRARAVIEATIHTHGDLLWTIARNDLQDHDEILRRASRFGFRAGQPHSVAVGLPSTGPGASHDEVTLDVVSLPELRRNGVHATRTEDGVLAVLPGPDSEQLAALLRSAPGATWGIADGSVPLTSLAGAYARARDVAVAAVVLQPGTAAQERDVGSYILLVQLQKSEGAQRVTRDVLGSLITYDEKKSRELTHTLAVYLAAGGNASAAARELHLNRHSLLYRLRRIEELTGRDLNLHDDRFLLGLALRLWQLERIADLGPQE